MPEAACVTSRRCTVGFQAGVEGLRREYPELELPTLEDWLREQRLEDKREVAAKSDKIGRALAAT